MTYSTHKCQRRGEHLRKFVSARRVALQSIIRRSINIRFIKFTFYSFTSTGNKVCAGLAVIKYSKTMFTDKSTSIRDCTNGGKKIIAFKQRLLSALK